MRLGLFGGTFNPIHFGHLRAALEVWEAFALDRILLIPAALPPHKKSSDIASPEDRFQMARLAIDGVPFMDVSENELHRTGPSYTIDTLQDFRARYGMTTSLFFVVGIDAFSEITTWKSYKDLFRLARFVVMTRPGARLKSLREFIQKHISNAYKQDKDANHYCHPSWQDIYLLSITHFDLSATKIRHDIEAGRSIRFLVPPQVDAYIQEKGLYR